MKFKTRKTWATMLLVGLMLATLLAACGDNNSNSTSQPAAGGQSPAAGAGQNTGQNGSGAASGPTVELNVMLDPASAESGPPPSDWWVYQKIKDTLNINLKFNMLPTGADGTTKLNAMAVSNSLPDLFQLNNNNRPLLFQYAQQGLLATVDSLYPMMPNRTKDRYTDENMKKLDSYNGKVYGLQETGAASLFHRTALVIRQDWLDKLGLKAPTTLDEFMSVAKAFTEKDPDGNGKNDTYGFGAFIDGGPGLGGAFDPIFGAFGLAGAWDLNDPNTFQATYQNPNYAKGVQFLAQLNQAKVLDPDWPTMKIDDWRARWKQGKYGMFVEDFCALSCSSNYHDFDVNNPHGKVVMIPPPKGPDGKSAVGAGPTSGNNWAVSKKALDSGKGQAIAKFLEWANSGEGYYALGFGQEGVNYKLDANGNISKEGLDANAAYDSKQSQRLLQMKWLAYKGSDPELHARYAAFKTGDGRDMDPLQYYKTANGSPWIDSSATQLIPPPSNSADVSRYISENLVQFVLGQKPLNDGSWKTFVDGLNGLGFQDYVSKAKDTLKTAGFLK
jgi:putative aldouronate transport system substrate-binding protein